MGSVSGKSHLGKVCTGCGEWKPLDGFSRQRGQVYDRNPRCRECKKKTDSKYQLDNKARISGVKKDYYKQNCERIKQKVKENYLKDPEPAKKRALEWNRINVERRKEIVAGWTRRNLHGKVRETVRRRAARKKGAYTIIFSPEKLQQKAFIGEMYVGFVEESTKPGTM